MKRILSALLVVSVFLTGCSVGNISQGKNDTELTTTEKIIEATTENCVEDTSLFPIESISDENSTDIVHTSDYLDKEAEDMGFMYLSDPRLPEFMEAAVYSHLIDDLGKDVCIDNVSAIYLSQEFLDELTYNSKSNVFFGYTLKELDEQFQDQSYLFTVDNGETVVKARSPYDDTYDKTITNVAIGTGVILICVTVSIVTYGAAPAVSVIFAAAAKESVIMALSSGAISGITAGITTGVLTGDWEKAKTNGLLAASEGFKYGAIAGAISGGTNKAAGLFNVSKNTQLTMNQVAIIQRETKLPLNLISEFQTFEQYEIVRDSGLYGKVVDGKQAIVRDIDLAFVKDGKSNLDRMLDGHAPIDPETGVEYELHHMGQTQDATIAILTRDEHRGVGNHAIWHDLISPSQVDHGSQWAKQKGDFWHAYALIST